MERTDMVDANAATPPHMLPQGEALGVYDRARGRTRRPRIRSRPTAAPASHRYDCPR
jgi:hypothetical protein